MPAVLIIGDVDEGRRFLGDRPLVLRRAEDAAGFRAIVDELSFVRLDATVVLSDLAASRGCAKPLARFLEETPNKVVCFASADVLDAAVESRFVAIVKFASVSLAVEYSPGVLEDALQDGKDPIMAVAGGAPSLLPALLSVWGTRFCRKLADVVAHGG